MTMVGLGLAHYGGTLGLYHQPRDEQVRALAFERQRRILAARTRDELERRRGGA